MRMPETASQVWSKLAGRKEPLMDRVERYAGLTVPKVCLPDGFLPETMDITHDYQSLGAQCVNHVTNKLMTAMFAPSRPFFRVAEGKTTKKSAQEAGITETDLNTVLASMERDAAKALDNLGQRPKLYQVMRHLVVAGNVLMILDKEEIRVMGLRYYCVQRDYRGRPRTIVTREKMKFCDLDERIQSALEQRYQYDDEISYYRLIEKKGSHGFHMTQWVDEQKLPKQWDARWSEKNFPYLALTWDLADESDYGTGLVEDYAGDFESLSVLSEALVTGAVVGTEFRWVANPNGLTSIEDFRKSQNGDTIPGNAKDIAAISPPTAEGVKMAQAVSSDYIQRISRGFLMTSAVTRDAERVTAEEVRMNAMELEGAFGGVYSALAPSIQTPMAIWMLAAADLAIGAADLNVVIVTGLDALSRNGDLENLRQAVADLAGFFQAPDALVARMKWQDLAEFVGQGRGVDLKRFIMSDAEFQATQQQQQAEQVAVDTATAEGEAQAQAAAQPTQGP